MDPFVRLIRVRLEYGSAAMAFIVAAIADQEIFRTAGFSYGGDRLMLSQ
jgi:hypothetical protein